MIKFTITIEADDSLGLTELEIKAKVLSYDKIGYIERDSLVYGVVSSFGKYCDIQVLFKYWSNR